MSWSIPSKEEAEEFTRSFLAAMEAYNDEHIDDMNEQDLIGETIKSINVDGFGIEIVFESGTTFTYSASDGGYSSWEIK